MPSGRDLPRGEYPRPQLVRKDWLCLNGRWNFAIDAGGNGEALGWPARARLAERIVVPFAPESRLSGIGCRDFMPCVWYARRFVVPASWRRRRVLLHFGAVDYEATVWVNGQRVGFHRGGYSPFAFEITSTLKSGSNLLVVRAVDDNRTGLQPCGKQSQRHESYGCRYSRITGIWQSVWLEPVGPAYIRSLRMVPDAPGGRLCVQVEIDRPHKGLTLAAVARAAGRPVGQASVAANSSVAACTLELSYVRNWDLEDPFLYDLELTLSDGQQVVDEVASYFGLRTITLAPPAIYLNDRPVFQRLVLDQGYYPAGLYTAPRDSDLKRDIASAQQLGFNGARLHQKVFEPRFLYWADRLGYLLWGEFGDWGIERDNGEALRRLAAEWTQVVLRDFNHPSVVGWCPFNEGRPWADPQGQCDVYELTRALDPTRPVIDSSGYHHYRTDVYDCHCYEQDPRRFAALFRRFARGGEPFYNHPGQAPYAGQPFFVSEYGGIWWNPGQKSDAAGWGYGQRPRTKREFLRRYRALTTTLLRHPRMCGFCYTQLYDVEQEVNGLMTYGRRMKFSPADIAAVNRQPAAIEKAC